MTNILLILAISLSLLYILYDQFIMDKRKGETRFAQINLSKQRMLIIDLKSKKRLFIRIQHPEDIEKVVTFLEDTNHDF